MVCKPPCLTACRMRIEILTFEGCPNARTARQRVAAALAEHAQQAELIDIEVTSSEAAQLQRFLGSPSVRINGLDVEPGADAREAYGLMCRTYYSNDAVEGAPTVKMICAAIRRALDR